MAARKSDPVWGANPGESARRGFENGRSVDHRPVYPDYRLDSGHQPAGQASGLDPALDLRRIDGNRADGPVGDLRGVDSRVRELLGRHRAVGVR